MKVTKLKQMIKPAEEFIVANSPTLLTGLGIAGMGAAIIFACKATPKYLELKETEEAKFTDDTKTSERVMAEAKCVAKTYWPTGLSFGLSATSLIFANKINLRRNAALLAAYTLSETALKDYKDQIKDKLSPKKVEEIERGVTQKRMERTPAEDSEVCYREHVGDMLMFDPNSGQYFYSTPDKIRQAKNYINDRLNNGDTVYRNDLYDELNELSDGRPKLKSCADGERRGWSKEYMDGLLSIGVRAPLDVRDHERPCWEIVYEDYDLPGYEY